MLIRNPKHFFDLMSQPRISSYRRYFGTNLSDTEILGVYFWNENLCHSFFKVLNLIEITVRNKLHKSLSNYYYNFPKQRVDKRSQNPLVTNFVRTIGSAESCNWYESGLLEHKSLSKVLDKTHHPKFKTPLRKIPSPDDVIASLTLGFWCSLFDKNPSFIWDDILLSVFPNHRYSKSFIFVMRPPRQPLSNPWSINKNIKTLYNRFLLINDVRNRIAHHEPLWKVSEIYDEVYKDSQNKKGNVILSKSTNVNETLTSLNLILDRLEETLSWMDTLLAEDYCQSSELKNLRWMLSLDGFNSYRLNFITIGNGFTKSKFKKQLNSILAKQKVVYFNDNKNVYTLYRIT